MHRPEREGRSRFSFRGDILRNEIVPLLFWALAGYLALALLSYDAGDPTPLHQTADQTITNLAGYLGAVLSDVLLWQFGYPALTIPVLLALWPSIGFYRNIDGDKPGTLVMVMGMKMLSAFLLLVAASALIEIAPIPNWLDLRTGSGGWIGHECSLLLQGMVGATGAVLVFLLLAMTCAVLTFNLSWIQVMEYIGTGVLYSLYSLWQGLMFVRELATNGVRWLQTERTALPDKPMKRESTPACVQPAPESGSAKAETAAVSQTTPEVGSKLPSQKPMFKGRLPPIDMLKKGVPSDQLKFDEAERQVLAGTLEGHLADFNVKVTVAGIHTGPVVTRFEVELAPGTKAKRISALAQDLARSLSVNSVRVVEVIPGKPHVGIEIPNRKRQTVYMGELIASSAYTEQTSMLALALGYDIAGQPIVADLAKMPHLLIAGTTGSGKSVAVNAILLSMLYKSTPGELRLILIDPKMLELSLYQDIPQLLAPVITEMQDAVNALRWGVGEMERRYRLMAATGVRSLDEFNQRVRDTRFKGEPLLDPLLPDKEGEVAPELQTLPSIVIVIDEFADMMMGLQGISKKAEQLITRLAQKARAAGIHLILATQRPSVEVITGLIKSNIPARLAFQVSSSVDSRVILDQNGAEQLLGFGDALFIPPGINTPLRVHGAFVDTPEVQAVTDYWRGEGEPEYVQGLTAGDPLKDPVPGLDDAIDGQNEKAENDVLYAQALHFVASTRRASISSVQRKFKIGYNRAARLIEAMEEVGAVSGPEPGGTREVLVGPPADD